MQTRLKSDGKRQSEHCFNLYDPIKKEADPRVHGSRVCFVVMIYLAYIR